MATPLVCLHGWGGSKESFDLLASELAGTDVELFIPDLPGFGSEPEPQAPYTVDDYARWVTKWIDAHVPSSPSGILLLGHSHGGRIAIKIASQKMINISHLYLCAAAGIKHPRHIKRIIGLTLAKAGKALLSIPGLKALAPLGKKFLYKLVRVHDYEKASDIMRTTMINVSREDLRPLLPTINVPTDLFWGTDDGMTPFSDAKIMEKEIPHATLHAFAGVRHAVHKDKAAEIASVIKHIATSNG